MSATRAPVEPTRAEAFLPLIGDAHLLQEAFRQDPGRWLPQPRHVGPNQWRIPVHGGRLRRPVVTTIGAPWVAGDTTWRSISWTPVSAEGDAVALEHLLPDLHGELGLDTRPDGSITMVLAASYDPPGGTLGAFLDLTAMHRVARTTLRRFLADVSAGLTAEALLLRASRNEPLELTSDGDPPTDLGAAPAGP